MSKTLKLKSSDRVPSDKKPTRSGARAPAPSFAGKVATSPERSKQKSSDASRPSSPHARPRQASSSPYRENSPESSNPWDKRNKQSEPSSHTPSPSRSKPSAPSPYQRTSHMQILSSAGERVSKRLANQGQCSRREADDFIEKGWVKVNGKTAHLGQRVQPHDVVTLENQVHQTQKKWVTIVLHKPVGYVSAQAEDGHEPAVTLITKENQFIGNAAQTIAKVRFTPEHLYGLAPAGRLDIDSTGLLIMTQDGRVAKALIGEDSTVEKEYLVRVEGRMIEQGLELLNHGLMMDGKKLKPAVVTWQNEDQLSFTLKEGRKRQIRRMCEMVGLTVVGLKRVRIGTIKLADLPVGQWRYLYEYEKF